MEEENASDAPISPTSLLFLGALVCFALFALLEPLLGYALFGTDSGEYYRLTEMLLANGHLPVGGAYTGGYTGWGYAYPDFPGLFIVAGGGASALGTDVFSALTILIPVLTALSVLPLFLLFRRMYPNDAVAILGAGLATFVMPRLFSIAHPAPLALGDLFAIAGLWMFVEGRRDPRWYAPLALVGAALIITHHLSSYFFLLSALGSLLLLELWRPRSWSRRFPTRELAFLGAFGIGMLVYWIEYAKDFSGVLASGGLPSALIGSPVPLSAGFIVILVLVGLLVRWRRAATLHKRLRVRLPTDAVLLRDGVIIIAGLAIGLASLLVIPLPGTTQGVTPATLLWFSPFIVTAGFAAGSRRLLTLSRLAPIALAWLVAIGLSAILVLAVGLTSGPASGLAAALPLGRHAEYLVIPLTLLIAALLGYLALRVEAVAGRRGLVAFGVGVAVLLAANAVIAYPPPQDLGGFEEGLTAQDAAMWMWVGSALPAGTVVATDHPLSSMLFGFDGEYATWQGTTALFNGNNRSAMLTLLESVAAPHCPYRFPAEIVAVDSTMSTGVALDPSQLAIPLSPSAQAWFQGAPFVPLYENGGQAIYWVDGPVGSTGTPASCTGS
jgi:hypothetical protein